MYVWYYYSDGDDMKVLKYKKVSGSKYSLQLDNGDSIKLYDNTIIYYDLLRKKDISNLDEVCKYNREIEAYYKSISYLNKKMRTTKEIRKYLEDYPSKTIDNTIERLSKEGYLNDQQYLKVFISNQIGITNNGPYKIVSKLVGLGFDKDEVLEELENYDRSIFISKLEKLVQKKIDSNTKYSGSHLKEKVLIDMINNGYDKKDIMDVLNNISISVDSKILEKEYNKAFKSLSKKYKGNDLEKRILLKLVNKGFNYNEAKEIISKGV